MKTVAIFCGGESSEFDISVKSATTILNNLPDDFQGYLVEVKKNCYNVITENGATPLDINDFSFQLKEEKITIDFVHIYIHGNPGENGKIQAWLDMKGVPYINSNALVSELSFDKWYCNQFLKSFNIKVAESILLKRNSKIDTNKIVNQLGLPIFVKPTDSGSSYGISKVKESSNLESAIIDAFKEGNTVVLEAFLKGTEVTCAAYENLDGIQTLPLTEIYTENDFFDYEAKYDGKSEEITPARISEKATKQVEDITREIYSKMGLQSLARIDYMLVNDVPYVIEVNTTPGFTAASIVPKMLTVAGISIKDFWTEIYKVMAN